MGKRWTHGELAEEFEVGDTVWPFLFVERREDGKRGTVRWDALEERYYDFEAFSSLPKPEL